MDEQKHATRSAKIGGYKEQRQSGIKCRRNKRRKKGEQEPDPPKLADTKNKDKAASNAGEINEERKGNRNLIRQNWRIHTTGGGEK
ncbi:MAG: hypothetical protein IJP76_04610 [Paludibacteraceae bacterium]|nr:hypothetical protein [Paludibacteraceae bacterium]